jgi:nucleoside-diphosphate-sugar epimerase
VPAGQDGLRLPKVEWAAADVSADDLAPIVRGADAVVHLAWAIQPSRDPAALFCANVPGSGRVFDAVATAGVPALVHASSTPRPRPRRLQPGGRPGPRS